MQIVDAPASQTKIVPCWPVLIRDKSLHSPKWAIAEYTAFYKILWDLPKQIYRLQESAIELGNIDTFMISGGSENAGKIN